MNKLQKTSVAGIFCMALTGCATTQFAHTDNPCNEGKGLSFLFGLATINNSKINESCSQDQVYKTLVDTEDPGVQAVGLRALIEKYGTQRVTKEVIDSLHDAKKPQNCTVQSVQHMPDGTKRIKLGNCAPASP